MTSGLPFDDFRALVARLPEGDDAAGRRVLARFSAGQGGAGSLGRVEEIAAWLARWTGRAPSVRRPLVAIFAGTHGVARQGISPRAVEETQAAVESCAAGGAAVNQVCLAHDLALKVFDLALHLPTGDITQEAALDERGCAATMAFGMEAVAGGTDLLCIGDLGVGNATVAAAVLAGLHGGGGRDWLDEGPGGDAIASARRAHIVDTALALHRSHLNGPLDVLRRLGGREFAAIAGAILAARMEKIPAILDGHAGIAAAAVLHALDPHALDHCLIAQWPADAGLKRAVDSLGLPPPLLDLGVRGGAGVGAALAAGIVKAAALVGTGTAAAR